MKCSRSGNLWVSALLMLMIFGGTCCLAQESQTRTVEATKTALRVTVPSAWESFTESPSDPTEVLFLQTPEGASPEVTMSFSVYPLPGSWDELIKRKNYQMLVFEDGPVTSNDALKLRGAPGHKWVYESVDPQGVRRLTYQLYLLLPPEGGHKRFLFVQAVAPTESALDLVPLFNEVARSMVWGIQAQLPETPSLQN